MCGFTAQWVEHRTGVAEVTGSNPVEALIFFRLLPSNCLNWKFSALITLHFHLQRSANINFIYISHELSLSCNLLEPTFLHGLAVWGGNNHLKLSSVKRSTAEIFWNIVSFLAPCLEVLPFWYLFCACAVSLELSSLSV